MCLFLSYDQSKSCNKKLGRESYKTIPLLMSSQRIFSVHYVIIWFLSINYDATKKSRIYLNRLVRYKKKKVFFNS